MFIEPEEPGDPFKVSDADTMLKFVAPDWRLKSLWQFSLNQVANSVPKSNKLCKTKVCLTKKSYWAKMQPLLPFALLPARWLPLKSSSAANTSAAAKIWKLTWLKTDSCLLKAVWLNCLIYRIELFGRFYTAAPNNSIFTRRFGYCRTQSKFCFYLSE